MSQLSADGAALLEKARRGDEPAFLALYREHRLPIYRFAWRLTGSAEAAEDVTQECFLALLSGARFDPGQGALRTYLFGVARHLAKKRVRLGERETEGADNCAAPTDSLTELLGRERAAAVAAAVAGLPALQREALILFEYEDLSLEEIATVAGVEVGAVKARLFRARENLRRRLAPLFAPCEARRTCNG